MPASHISVCICTFKRGELLKKLLTKLEGQQANTMIRLLEALEDHDDVQHVWSNFDIDQKQLEEVVG